MKKLLLIISFLLSFVSYNFAQEVSGYGTELGPDDANIYIDPVRRIVKVVYAVSKNSEVHFKVINEAGETVFSDMKEEVKGEHSRLIDLGKVAGKNYIVEVESDKLKQREKISFN